MKYADWEAPVPTDIRNDVLWSATVYRQALFVAKIGWEDITKLAADSRTRSLADQLCRALGSISANFAEGYSRSTDKDRARFFEYSLGSARESRDWYYKAEFALPEGVMEHRINLLMDIIRQLLVILNNLRKRTIREKGVRYEVDE